MQTAESKVNKSNNSSLKHDKPSVLALPLTLQPVFSQSITQSSFVNAQVLRVYYMKKQYNKCMSGQTTITQIITKNALIYDSRKLKGRPTSFLWASCKFHL